MIFAKELPFFDKFLLTFEKLFVGCIQSGSLRHQECKMIKRTLLLSATAFVLASCASTGQVPRALDVAPDSPASWASAEGINTAPIEDWVATFDDPVLMALINEATTALGSFINDGGTLTLKMAPSTPLSVAAKTRPSAARQKPITKLPDPPSGA